VSLRRRMMLAMVSVVAISVAASMLAGGYLLSRRLNQGAENRVRQDLNAAREFYNQRLAAMGNALHYTALGERFSDAVKTRDTGYLTTRLDAVRESAGLDLLSVTDAAGSVIVRSHRPDYSGDSLADDRLIALILGGEDIISGTMLMPIPLLEKEEPALAERARTHILATPRETPSDVSELDSGTMLCAAAAVRGPDGALVGVLRAGVLVNRNYTLVDQVRNTVFRDERYGGKLVGAATIFQGDVRISTNVQRKDGSRAIGTRVSSEVYDRVLCREKTWVGTAWVVNDWYVSAYEPIHDLDNKAIGMLYVGVLERKFRALALRTLSVFALVTLVGFLVAGVIGWRLADSISRPVGNLASASASIARGDFSQMLRVESGDEIGSLTRTFNTMARSLKERDELLKERTRLQLTRSERLASIGRLAAGCAHEINNPLTGVLTFAHMLLRNAPENSQDREDLEAVIGATIRCKEIVRGLLDFSRQSEPHKGLSDLNAVLREALNLTRNQASIGHVSIVEELDPHLPHLIIDANQIQEVAVNVIVNGIDAMPDGGRLTIRTRCVDENDRRWAEVEIADNGCGISAADLNLVFDPFFTTKPTGKGTGLGLAIAYGIVTEHGGRITVSSEVGSGTTVAVRLPLTAEEHVSEDRSDSGGR